MRKAFYLIALCLLFIIGCANIKPISEISETSSFALASESTTSLQATISSENTNEYVNDDYKYKIENNNITIIKYLGNAVELTIPDKIDGLQVKVIDKMAFYANKTLGKVILPEHCEIIRTCAFEYSNIYEIIIPDSATEISSAAFSDCLRELVLLYHNNPLFPQYGIDNNVLCAKADEYNPVLPVELVGGKPLNDEKSIGISQNDYNLVRRKTSDEYELYGTNDFDHISFERYIYNGYIDFFEGDDTSDKAIKEKLTKTATLLYQCGITEFDPKTVNTGKEGCFDKLVLAAIYCRSPEQLKEDEFTNTNVRFVDDILLHFEAECLFDLVPNSSLVTGYSKQQHGIWYYPKEFPKITTDVLSYSGNLKGGDFILKAKFTNDSGVTCEKTFSFSLVKYHNESGSDYRVILKGIQ